MYDKQFIDSCNDGSDAYGRVRAVLNSLKMTEDAVLVRARSFDAEGDNCALHVVKPPPVERFGCANVSDGTHPSIVALRESDIRYCHAELGSRKIDLDFAMRAADLKLVFIESALNVSAKFAKRFCGGASVEWSRYGPGYCYLSLLHSNFRHRAARILGAYPLVATVCRFACLVGNWSQEGFCFTNSGAYYHVSLAEWTPATSMVAAIEFLHRLPVGSRIGGVIDVEFPDSKAFGLDVFESDGISTDDQALQPWLSDLFTTLDEIVGGFAWDDIDRTDYTFAHNAAILVEIIPVHGETDIVQSKLKAWEYWGRLQCDVHNFYSAYRMGNGIVDYETMRQRQLDGKFLDSIERLGYDRMFEFDLGISDDVKMAFVYKFVGLFAHYYEPDLVARLLHVFGFFSG